jgi:beta-glucosidase
LTLSNDEIKSEDSIVVSVDVTNIGEMDGMEVVQMYISDHFSSVIPPGKSLKAFKKINLMSGKKETVTFVISEKDFIFVDSNNNWISEPGTFTVNIGGLTRTFELK